MVKTPHFHIPPPAAVAPAPPAVPRSEAWPFARGGMAGGSTAVKSSTHKADSLNRWLIQYQPSI
jgi:hypothetical protein